MRVLPWRRMPVTAPDPKPKKVVLRPDAPKPTYRVLVGPHETKIDQYQWKIQHYSCYSADAAGFASWDDCGRWIDKLTSNENLRSYDEAMEAGKAHLAHILKPKQEYRA